jgi:hypothetical protein
MRATEFLSEGALSPGELFKHKYLDWRPQNFLAKLEAGTPFVDKGGNEYYPEDGEYNRVLPLVQRTLDALAKKPDSPLPSITLNIKGVGPMAVSKFEKADLQTAKGKVTSDVNVQPIGIGIATDPVNKPGTKAKDKITLSMDQEVKRALDANKGIRAGQLYNIIAKNTVLDSAGELGQAVKDAAKQISQGMEPDISKYPENIQMKVAIDAGEYLGILAMVYNVASWYNNKQDAFLKFLGTPNFNNLMLIFPGEQNASLSDSYGVQNAQTGQTIMISSKGGKGKTALGAAPSLSGLKRSLEKRGSKIKPGNALDFIQTIISISPTVGQGFGGMNWMQTYYPEFVPAIYSDILPFTTEDMEYIKENIRTNGRTKIPAKFNKLLKTYPGLATSKATVGGKLAYAVTRDLVNVVNESNVLEDFRSTILELLEENFVQIYSRIVRGKLTANVLWPGKIDGNVYLHTKIDPGNPGNAGLSFKLTD